jgi:LysM repeat protein
MAAGCAENYVVQANDSLSAIADKYFGDMQAYSLIVEATNAAAANNQTYIVIDNPDVINVGQTLCIPGSPQAQTPAGAEGATTPTDSAAMAADQPSVEVPEGKGMLIFENYAFVDLVFDLSGPMADSAVVVPDGKQEFVLDPGSYNYNAHQPGGDYSVQPGAFDIAAGRERSLVCFDSPVCELQAVTTLQAPQPGQTEGATPLNEPTLETTTTNETTTTDETTTDEPATADETVTEDEGDTATEDQTPAEETVPGDEDGTTSE